MQQSQGEGAWKKHHTVFTNAKAGMDKVDKDHVQKIVYEMSKVPTTSRLTQRCHGSSYMTAGGCSSLLHAKSAAPLAQVTCDS